MPNTTRGVGLFTAENIVAAIRAIPSQSHFAQLVAEPPCGDQSNRDFYYEEADANGDSTHYPFAKGIWVIVRGPHFLNTARSSGMKIAHRSSAAVVSARTTTSNSADWTLHADSFHRCLQLSRAAAKRTAWLSTFSEKVPTNWPAIMMLL